MGVYSFSWPRRVDASSIGRSSTGGGPRPFSNVATRHAVQVYLSSLNLKESFVFGVRLLYTIHSAHPLPLLSGALVLQSMYAFSFLFHFRRHMHVLG